MGAFIVEAATAPRPARLSPRGTDPTPSALRAAALAPDASRLPRMLTRTDARILARGPLALALAALLVLGGCGGEQARPPPEQRATLPSLPWKPAAIAHAGAGSPPGRSDGCRAAVDAALAALEKGADPVDAAVAGVVVLEDDPRFNAG